MDPKKKPPVVAHDVSAAQYVKVNGREDKCVGLVVQDRAGESDVWIMEEDAVDFVPATLGGGLSDHSTGILTQLSKSDIISSWELFEDGDGVETLRLVLYGQVECLIPTHEANSAIQMLDRVLHAQGHKQLAD